MLGQVLVLTLLLLKGHGGQELFESDEDVVGLSGTDLWLRPPRTQTKNIHSVQWKMRARSASQFSVILTCKNGFDLHNCTNWALKDHNRKFSLTINDSSLVVQAAQRQDSGIYVLEVTDKSGEVKKFRFRVSVFDHVGTIQEQQALKVLDGGKCQVTLSCLVSGGGNATYEWHRGHVLIETARNLSKLEEKIDANSSHEYTCNVSNLVSWVKHTFTQHCPSDYKQDNFLYLLVIIVISLITLFLGALISFCVWRRRRKQSRPRTEDFLTVYEDVNSVRIRRTQEQKLNPSEEGSTIYSMIQSQPPASTSQETNTLYALVQPSRKSESKKNHRSSLNNTIYEEVGKRQLKAQNPARLSRRELENFCVYS